jgi:large subunit ribosomal protein L10
MNRTEKQEVIDGLKADLKRSGSVVVADFTNMTVAQADDLRGKFFAQKLTYKVVKNKLFVQALAGTDMESMGTLCVGPTAVGIGYDDPAAPARIMSDFAKANANAFKIKGGFTSGKALTAEGVKALSAMPTLPQLRAILLGIIAAPARRLVSQLKAPHSHVVGVNQARIDEGGKK